MATPFAPPARRGDFLFSSIFYADPGNANHHPRASVAELAALLRPETVNLYSYGRQPEAATPAKDPPWHFYSAQLIHYGLPVTKDKNTAKVRLLNALNQFKLEVPAWVLKVEGGLKKEWEKDNKKIKKAGGASTDVGARGGKVAKTTGTADAVGVCSGVNVTVNLNLLSGPSTAEQLGFQHGSGSSPTKPSPSKRKRAENNPRNIANLEASPKRATRIKSESALKTSVKKELSSTPARSRVKYEETPPRSSYKSSPRVKPDPYANSITRSQNHTLLSGEYDVTCSSMNSLYDSFDITFTLYLNPLRDIWWASITWGPLHGLIQMNPGPGTPGAIGRPCSLGWRLRDIQDNSLTFGRKCTGEITFFADQTFRGVLYQVPDVGTVEIEGMRLAGLSLEGDFQQDWDAFVTEAYGR